MKKTKPPFPQVFAALAAALLASSANAKLIEGGGALPGRGLGDEPAAAPRPVPGWQAGPVLVERFYRVLEVGLNGDAAREYEAVVSAHCLDARPRLACVTTAQGNIAVDSYQSAGPLRIRAEELAAGDFAVAKAGVNIGGNVPALPLLDLRKLPRTYASRPQNAPWPVLREAIVATTLLESPVPDAIARAARQICRERALKAAADKIGRAADAWANELGAAGTVETRPETK